MIIIKSIVVENIKNYSKTVGLTSKRCVLIRICRFYFIMIIIIITIIFFFSILMVHYSKFRKIAKIDAHF